VEKLENELKAMEMGGLGIAIVSRAHLQNTAVAVRKWYRNITMYVFHYLVAFLCVANVRDTQCGFKLFTRLTAQCLFATQHIRRWCFDVELLYVAQRLDIPIVEVEVNWSEVPGSKLRLIEASLMMARDLLVIRLSYMLRIWKIKLPPNYNKKVK